jgi:hypothetical protein
MCFLSSGYIYFSFHFSISKHVHINNWNTADEYWGANEPLPKSANSMQSKTEQFRLFHVCHTRIPSFSDQQLTASVVLTSPDVSSPFPLCFCRILSHVHHWNCGGFRRASECECGLIFQPVSNSGSVKKLPSSSWRRLLYVVLRVSTPCSLLCVYRRFEEIFCLIIQGWIM